MLNRIDSEEASRLLENLHNHPGMENTLDLDEDHVIIDCDLFMDIKMMLDKLTREASDEIMLKSAT